MKAWVYTVTLSVLSAALLTFFWIREPVHLLDLPALFFSVLAALFLLSFEIVFVYGAESWSHYSDSLLLLLILCLLCVFGPTFALFAQFLAILAFVSTKSKDIIKLRARIMWVNNNVLSPGLPFLLIPAGFSFWTLNILNLFLLITAVAFLHNLTNVLLMIFYDVFRYNQDLFKTLRVWFSLSALYFYLFGLLFFPSLSTLAAYVWHVLPWTVALFIPLVWLLRNAAESHQQVDREMQNAIEIFQEALEVRDPYTEAHCGRVSEYAKVIAKSYGLSYADVERIGKEARLHDIGKLLLDDEVLAKPGSLTREEYEHIKLHTRLDNEFLNRLPKQSPLARWLDVARLHHERWDGNGYPWGLKGEEIPLDARIMSVADAWDAMTSNRIYRAALSEEAALKNLQDYSGKQWDPEAVKAFLKAYESGAIQAAKDKHPDH